MRAYQHISVDDKDVEKNAVTTSFGQFGLIGLPVGLLSAAQTPQICMESVARTWSFRVYLDDFVIASPKVDELMKHLKNVSVYVGQPYSGHLR